jgi:hypothetical protein
MIESIRVLKASPALRNNILFLFSDGEELGWQGALGYLQAHPKSKDEIGVVLCFDGRPGNGQLVLWETSPKDAWLVNQMTGLPLSLYAGSWTNQAERGERDTDFSIFSEDGFTGVEIENAEAGTRYHTTRDTVDTISPNLLQGFGRTMLTLTNHFGSIDMNVHTSDHDLAFFTLPLLGLVAYPAWLMPVLNILGFLTFVALVVVSARQNRFSFGRFGWGLLCLLLGIVIIVIAAQLAWGGVKASHAEELAALDGFEASTSWLTGFMFGAIVLMIVLLVVLSRRLGSINLVPVSSVIYLLVWFVVYFLMDADNPLTTAYIALPFLGGLAGMAVMLFTRKPAWKAALLTISALTILVLQVPQLWLATYTREDAWVPVLATCITMGFFAPQLEAIFGKAFTP